MGGLLSSLVKNFVQVLYLRLSHMFYQRKRGENRQGSVLSWKVKKMGPVDRHKLVQSWSSCRYTHTEQHLGDSVSTATSGKKERDGDSWIQLHFCQYLCL